MRILVTGAGGQLGHDVVEELNGRGIETRGIDRKCCDLTDMEQTKKVLLDYRPDAVIHCAAYTAVDKAEDETAECRLVNVTATENIARICKEMDAAMMYISTEYIFSGEGVQPYETDSPKAPQSVYGQTKYEGELAVQAWLERFFIVRVSWVFGHNGSNFVKTMCRLGAQRDCVNVVNDQIGAPTYTRDLARLLCDMMGTKQYGVYHASNEGECSWYDFAKQIMTLAQLPCEVYPVTSAEYAARAKRPHNSRLSKKSLDTAGFERLPTWQDALERYMKENK